MKRRDRKPRTIAIEGAVCALDIIGTEPGYLPYLSIAFTGGGGYIKDRDVIRLKQWCELIIRRNKASRRDNLK